MKRVLVFVTVLVFVLSGPGKTRAQGPYTVTDLGALGGTYSQAFGINNVGRVVGYAYRTGNTAYRAFRTAPYSPINIIDDLGTLGGSNSNAYGVNDAGQVVGDSRIAGDVAVHAFCTATWVWAGNDLGTLGGTDSTGYGINVGGQVVGISDIAGDLAEHAFRTGANLPISPTTDDLGTLGGSRSEARAINTSGQVVGQSYITGDTNTHAFRTLSPTGLINPTSDDLGTLGGVASYGYGINDSGQAVGTSNVSMTSNIWHAFRTASNLAINSATDDLGVLSLGTYAEALSINASGKVVGWSATNGTDDPRAFLYTGGTMLDLNALIAPQSGWTLLQARSINDRGDIVGYGSYDPDGPGGNSPVTHGFLLNEVPEPSTLVLLGVGAISLLCCAWRRRKRAHCLS